MKQIIFPFLLALLSGGCHNAGGPVATHSTSSASTVTTTSSITAIFNGASAATGTSHWSGTATYNGTPVQINMAIYSDGSLMMRNVTSGAVAFASTWMLLGTDTMSFGVNAYDYVKDLLGITGSVASGELYTTNAGDFTLQTGSP